MRRSDREITDPEEILGVMDRCTCCRLGFYDDGEVYLVPLSFGYARVGGQLRLYFHGAGAGRKAGLIRRAPSVGFEMDTDYRLNEGPTACACSAGFRSIIGTGRVSPVESRPEKEAALRKIMEHLTRKSDWQFTDKGLDSVFVFQLEVASLACKAHD